MEKALAATKPRAILHDRANWSARDDRLAFVIWLAFIWVGILFGFGLTMRHFLHAVPHWPTVVYIHAAAFTIWLVLLTAQVLLVIKDRVQLHRNLGWFLVGWACLMAVLGPWAAFAAQTIPNGPVYKPPFLSIQLGDILAFVALLAWGISLRKNPAAHKRIMILSTIALLDAGYGRLSGWVLHVTPHSMVPNWLLHAPPHSMVHFYVLDFYGNFLLLALMAATDWWRGRLMKQFAIGALGLFAWECFQVFLLFWPPWKVFATALLADWVKYFH